MTTQTLREAIALACKQLFGVDIEPELSRPDEQFGDYATNASLKLAKDLNKNPREIASALAELLRADNQEFLEDVSVAGPGFINFKLSDRALAQEALEINPYQHQANNQVLVEFGDMNPLKVFHLGHLYATIVGDTIARLFETAGAEVERLSYHGDVGMHVAKAIWAIGTHISWDVSRLTELESDQVVIDDQMLNLKTVIGFLYAQGAAAYESDPSAAHEIREVNKSVYMRDRQDINTIYEWGVKKSFAYFDMIFEELGVEYQKRYLESQSAPIGTELVRQNTGQVFEESNGAIIYRGEQDGLHTRVFINSEGLPTYDAKDLGLAMLKDKDYPDADKSIIITANEQTEYFKVMLAALTRIKPELAAKTEHIAHGFLSLTTGKMSSRTGNVFGAQSLMDTTRAMVQKSFPDSDVQDDVYLAALKYTFLKSRIGGDIVFDVQESVSLEGNSGPYIQYAYARAKSILRKSSMQPAEQLTGLEQGERSLVRKMGEYEAVLEKATLERMPHHVCTYLYELAQTFNSFYEHNRVIGEPREQQRLKIIEAYAAILKDGLKTLGIPAPEKM